jgi:hypothetical protein
LNDSLRRAGHNEPHYVLLIDYEEKYKEIIDKFNFLPVFLNELGIPKVDELITKYSAFELSNVLRPYFMDWLLKNHKEINILVYLDTDVYVYSPLSAVFDYLEKNRSISVLLTPHLSDFESYSAVAGYKFEGYFLKYGLYNSGFYVLKNDQRTHQFLEWLKIKLFDYCYNAPSAYMFVDQKILDLAPVLFDFVGIYKNKAYNIAHWNYSSNLIREDAGIYYVGNQKLVFFHFSQLRSDVAGNFYFDVLPQDKQIFKKIASEYLIRLENNGHGKIKNTPYGYSGKYKKFGMSQIYNSGESRMEIYLRRIINFLLPSRSLRRESVKYVYNKFKK